MIRNALTGEAEAKPKDLAQQQSDFTAEGAPSPGHGWPATAGIAQVGSLPAGAFAGLARPSAAGLQAAGLSVSNIALDDWDTLLGAVTARLRQAVAITLPHELNGATAPLQASVLECADALDQLHATVRFAVAQPSSLLWRDGNGGDRPGQPAQAKAAVPPVAAPTAPT